MINEYDATALLALPKVKDGIPPERGLLISSRPFMIDEIRNLGVDVAVSRGVKAFDVENNEVIDTYRPEYLEKDGKTDVFLRDLGRTCLDDFGVIRSIIGAIHPVNSKARFLNPNSVRSLSSNKIVTADSILSPIDAYGRDYVEFNADDDKNNIDDYIDLIPGDELVAKPISGSRSEGIFVGSKAQIAEALKTATGKYIIEEKLTFVPLPSLRGINYDEIARLNKANDESQNRELRMYYFGNNTWDSVVRIGASGEKTLRNDDWAYIDHESIPSEVISRSADVISAIQRLIPARDNEFHIAVDWIYGNCASNKEPNWKVMEINAGEPQLVQISENKEIGERQHKKLATQIARIALS